MITLGFYLSILTSLTFLALNVADCVLTKNVLDKGGRELNPLFAWMLRTEWIAPYVWTIKMVAAVFIVWLLWHFTDYEGGHPIVIIQSVLSMMYVYVVAHNWDVWQTVKDR